jgi:REP element-mobilizing transposase RayT
MARKVRLEFAGACYHVLNRGNYRRDLFAEKGSADAFESCLGETAMRFGWRVHAFVVMRNHFHLVLWPQQGSDISAFMRWFMNAHIRRLSPLQ